MHDFTLSCGQHFPQGFFYVPLTPNSGRPQDRAGEALLPSSWTGRLDWQWPCPELGLPAGVGSTGRGGEGTWRGDCRSGCRLRVRRRRGPRGVLGLGSLVSSAGAVPASQGMGGAQQKVKGSPSGTYINQWTGRREAADEGPTDGRAEIQVCRGCPGDLGEQPEDKAGLRTKRKILATVVVMRVP